MKIRLNLKLFITYLICTIALLGCQQKAVVTLASDNGDASESEILAQTDGFEIVSKVIQRFDDGYTVPLVSLSIRDKRDGSEKPLLKTIRPTDYCWYVGDGSSFQPISIDSIFAAQTVEIICEKPLKLIVEGCPDMRNVFSFIVDVANRKAWHVPANSGYLGETEEGYLIFQSYRYSSDPDRGGRYTFLQIFDDKGCMIDSLDLEHHTFDY